MKSLSIWVLAALALGLAAGAGVGASAVAPLRTAGELAEALGLLWLDALRMTVVPLIFCLIVTAIAAVADAAATGRLAARALLLFAVLIITAALYGVFATQGLLALWPIAPEAAAAFQGALAPAPAEEVATPSLATWLRSLAPANPIRAAAEDAILPLTVFAAAFGFASTRLPGESRAALTQFFKAAGDAMIQIVRWVLAAAPIGVFGLALGVGLRAGVGAAGLILQYVAIVSAATIGVTLLVYLLPVLAGRTGLVRFARAAAPVQALAFSTQSSIACLPAMVEQARTALGAPERVAGLVLPLAVAVFRLTSPVANLATALLVAELAGHEPSVAQIAAAIAAAFAVSVSSVGLPGQVSFIASLAPICIALGAPLEALGVLLAVEVIPDIFRTVGNVTADLAATTVLSRDAPQEDNPGEAPSQAPAAPM
jgi:Na+/H+-dicarboxylate symporter